MKFLSLLLCVLSLPLLGVAQPRTQIIVKYRSAIDAQKVMNSFAASPTTTSIGGKALSTITATFPKSSSAFPVANFLTMSVADPSSLKQTLAALNADPAVEYAQVNGVYHVDSRDEGPGMRGSQKKNSAQSVNGFVPNDSAFASQWNLARVQMPDAWVIEKGDKNVLIAFIDTGIDWDHDDFYAQGKLASVYVNPAEDINHDGLFEPWRSDTSIMYRGQLRTGDLDGIDQDGNGVADDVIGYDFVDQAVANLGDWIDRDPVPFDDYGHGTAIAGVIAAQTNNSIGVAGVAFGCRVLPVRALDATGNGEDDDIAAGIIYAADFQGSDGARVRVINMSFGDVTASPIMHDAIRYAKQRGIIIVCSSGNNGGTGAHYPSNYPECISVGATEESDYVVGTSGIGNAITMTAPGADIPTTAVGNAYQTANGTSVAAPHVAAAAALVISHLSSLKPDDVRGILQTTCDDIDFPGWDIHSGAGRLNVAAALNAFAAQVILSSPRQDTGIAGDTVLVTGTVALPYFSWYRVLVGIGDDPTTWKVVRDTTRRQSLGDTLGVWLAAGIPDGPVVMRLVVATSDNKTLESRARFFLERTAPASTKFRTFDALLGDHHIVEVDARSDQLTSFTVSVRPKGSSSAFVEKKQIDAFTKNHFIVLDVADLAANTPYEMFGSFENAAGLVTRVDNSGAPFTITRSGEAFPTTNFVQKPYALKASVLSNVTADIFKDNGKCVAEYDENTGGGLMRIAEFRDGKFDTRDSLFTRFIPRGIGKTRSDSLLQIWSQSGEHSILWSQTAAGGAPLHSIAFADTTESLLAVGMADFDGDGISELIAFSGSDIVILKQQSGSYAVIARLPNPTPVAPDQSDNIFSYPTIATGDFDGDGRMELAAIDGDADVYVYEYNPSTRGFDNTFSDLNTGEDAYITSGDFNGDGKKDFAVAYHSTLLWNADREHDAPVWTVKIYSSDRNDHFAPLWSTNISGVKPPSTFRGGLAAGDLNGLAGDELFLNTFPSSYVFTWDAARQTMAPLTYFPFGATNTAIIADFDGNHVNELGFYTGTETDFFEYEAAHATPATPLNFTAIALDSTRATLKWDIVPGATSYEIYRGKFLPADANITLSLVATVPATPWNDSLLESRGWYAYGIVADGASEKSVGTPTITVHPHPAAGVFAIDVSALNVKLKFTELMPQSPVQPSFFSDNLNGAPSSVISSGDSSVTLVWKSPLRSGQHDLTIGGALDYYGMPVIKSTRSFTYIPGQQLDSFYIASSSVPDPHRIALVFSCAVDSADAAVVSHYAIAPIGHIIAAQRDSALHTRVLLTLDNSSSIGAFGKTWTVHVTDLKSESCGAIVEGSGSTIGIVMHREDLSDVFVYPNPSRTDLTTHCTFANLTPKAEITIFTLSGARIAAVSEQNGDGGVEWNFMDSHGDLVKSGVYLFYASGKNSAGEDVPAKVGKFAVVR